MRGVLLLFTCLLLFSICSRAQNLLPAINNGVIPNNSDPVCATPWYNNLDFDTTGYLVGDTVNDFTLFSINGDTFNLASALAQGKPVLLMAGSLTCPYFRSQLSDINAVATAYSSYITPMVVYVIEAHPTDTSPYSGTINVTNQNINQGVLFPQPTTFLERKNLVDTLLQNYTVNFPMVIDGPCNEWWHAYGPAPLNAYLVDTSGIVILKHAWFHQYPDNIFCDLDSILNISTSNCVPNTPNGFFMLNNVTTTVYGSPGQMIYTTGDLINNSANGVLIEVVKTNEVYAPGWNSSFCMGICYSTNIDSTTIYLSAGDTMHFSLDFFTSLTPDSSRVRVGFRNANTPTNSFGGWFYALTTATDVNASNSEESLFDVYPNPATGSISIGLIENPAQIWIYDSQGRAVLEITSAPGQSSVAIDITLLTPGVYYIRQSNNTVSAVENFIKQ